MSLLVAVALVAGAAAAWIFHRTAEADAIRATVNRIEAHLLEFWLFVDEPAAIAKSWLGLLRANGRLLRLMLLPVAILSIVTVPLFFWLDAKYGTAPLPVGKAAVVTLSLDRVSPVPELQAPDGIEVEGPAVRVPSLQQVSWRIRPVRPLAGELRWITAGHIIERRISAGEPFSSVHWSVWFVGFSLIGALAEHYLRKAAATRRRN